MTDKLVSAADAIRRERAAYLRGANAEQEFQSWHRRTDAGICPAAPSHEEANRLYPLPRKTVPREIVEGVTGNRFRVMNGEVEAKTTGLQAWTTIDSNNGFLIDADRVRIFANLFASPTVEVDADD